MAETLSKKRKALIAKKETLIKEIKYYEMKVKKVQISQENNFFHEDDSSESECEFVLNTELSVTELKLMQRMLKTCLQATQELTNVVILQSEINILPTDTVVNYGTPVTEEGVWREVMADCRIDLVPFSINFHTHTPSRLFAPISYRNLQVIPVKKAHETELAKSVLATLTRPSDAVEMMRNYAAAIRSRRSTLARLTESFGEKLFMEPAAEGGFVLKCAGLLEVQWTLQNKWSPIAPFHHRMKFDLEYMDESYIKIITQLHRQIIDPSLETDERTLILAKIIKTCLEANASPQEPESTESEPDNARKLQDRRTTLDQEPDVPSAKAKNEVMAPPRALPKKRKHKGKENTVDNQVQPAKRTTIASDLSNPKKPKVTDSKNSDGKSSRHSNVDKENEVELKNNVNSKEQIDTIKDKTKNVKNKDNKKDDIKIQKKRDKIKNVKSNTHSNVEMDKQKVENKDLNENSKRVVSENLEGKDTNNVKKSRNENIAIEPNNQNKQKPPNESTSNKLKAKNMETQSDTRIKDKIGTEKTKTGIETKKETISKERKVKESDYKTKEKTSIEQSLKPNKTDNFQTKKMGQKAIVKVRKENESDIVKEKRNTEGNLKPNNKQTVINKQKNKERLFNLKVQKEKDNLKSDERIRKGPLVKNTNDFTKKPNTINYIKNQFIKKPQTVTTKELTTKIPTKRISLESFKSKPLRISPRKPQPKLKLPAQDVSKLSKGSQKSIQKFTNIPRLMKKPQGFQPRV